MVIRQSASLAGVSGDVPYWEMTLDFGCRFARMVIAWCDDTLAFLDSIR